jgi:hypothetical protein
MPPKSSPQAEHISQAWSASWPYSTIVHTCHVPHPAIRPPISTGGEAPYPKSKSHDPYQAPTLSTTSMLTQMLALKWASESPSASYGERGASSQDGGTEAGTSGGPKQSVFSS